jgi:hypothetical protein
MAGEAFFSYNSGNEGPLVRLNIRIETSQSYKTHLTLATVPCSQLNVLPSGVWLLRWTLVMMMLLLTWAIQLWLRRITLTHNPLFFCVFAPVSIHWIMERWNKDGKVYAGKTCINVDVRMRSYCSMKRTFISCKWNCGRIYCVTFEYFVLFRINKKKEIQIQICFTSNYSLLRLLMLSFLTASHLSSLLLSSICFLL